MKESSAAGLGAERTAGAGASGARRVHLRRGNRQPHFFIDSDQDTDGDEEGEDEEGEWERGRENVHHDEGSCAESDSGGDWSALQSPVKQHLVYRHSMSQGDSVHEVNSKSSSSSSGGGSSSRRNSSDSKTFADKDRWQQQRRHRHRRGSWDLDSGQRSLSPWSRWQLVLKLLLYGIVLPTAIIYVLQRVDHSLKGQNDGLTGEEGLHGGMRRDSVQQQQPQQQQQHQQQQQRPSWQQHRQQQHQQRSVRYQGGEKGYESSSNSSSSSWSSRITNCCPWKETLSSWGLALRNRHLGRHHRLHPSPEPQLRVRNQQQQQQQQQASSQQQQRHRQPFDSTMVHQTFFDSFVLFGDSITQYSFDVHERGFGAQLAHLFQRRLDLINRGFSGYTSEQAIHLLPQLLPHAATQPTLSLQQDQNSQSSYPLSPPKIQFLTIFFGANDACLSPSPQHVDLDRYERNMRTMIDMVHDPSSPTYSPETRIIIICPPPIDEARWEIRRKERGLPMDRDEEVAKQYAETCLRIGREYAARSGHQQQQQRQVDVIDTWGIMMHKVKAGDMTLDDYLKDGLHLASAGNNVIFEEIMKVVRGRYPEWDPETMPMHAPWWGDLDRQHPEIDLLICGNKPTPSS